MKLLRSFPILAFAVVLLGIVGVSVATRSLGLLLVGGVLAALSWYVTEGPRGRSLPNWTATILIVAVCLNVVVDLAQHYADVMGVLARFVVWLTLIKLYQQKSPRDYAQLLGLSLLMMMIGCLESNGLLFAATLLLYAVLGLYVLLLYQLYAAFEHGRAARLEALPAGYRLVPSLQPIVGRRSGLHLRVLVVAVAGAGLLASGVFFVLFPREVGAGVIRFNARQNRAGYTDDVNLTSGTRITDSRRVVLNVRVSGETVSPPLRLRGAALDRYDGRGRWHRSTLHRRRTFETSPPGMTSLGPAPGPSAVTQEVELLMPSTTVFGLGVPVAIGTKHPRRFRFDPRHQTIEDIHGSRLQRYTIVSETDPSDSALRTLIGSPRQTSGAAVIRQFANLDPRVAHLARGLLEAARVDVRPPESIAQRWARNAAGARVLERYLRSGRFDYDTDLRDVQLAGADGTPKDPIVQFLFETKRGHCEYFASALAAMCNVVGIPARLVTGYVALEYDERAGVYIVRESNAHAWVEVQTSPYRWATYDPTPPATLRELHGGRHTRADRWRWLFDRFEAKWSNNFVAFDRQVQERLIRSLDAGWSARAKEAVYAIREWAARINRAFYMGPAGYIWMGIVALAVAIAAVAVWTRMRRAAQLRAAVRLEHAGGSAQHRMVRQLGFYLDMLRLLQRSGQGKPSWQPPLLFARTLARRQAPGASLVRQIAELFYAARYGGRRLTREEIIRAEGLVRDLAGALGK